MRNRPSRSRGHLLTVLVTRCVAQGKRLPFCLKAQQAGTRKRQEQQGGPPGVPGRGGLGWSSGPESPLAATGPTAGTSFAQTSSRLPRPRQPQRSGPGSLFSREKLPKRQAGRIWTARR